jgi:hypothetical protein
MRIPVVDVVTSFPLLYYSGYRHVQARCFFLWEVILQWLLLLTWRKFKFVIRYNSVNVTVVCLYYQTWVRHLLLYNIYIKIQDRSLCIQRAGDMDIFSCLIRRWNTCVFDKIRVKVFSNNNISFELRVHTIPFFDLIYNGLITGLKS